MNLDRRLLNQALNHRFLVLAAVGLCLAAGLLVVWQTSLLTRAIEGVFLNGQSLEDLWAGLALLMGVICLRALVSWVNDTASSVLSKGIRTSLRERLVRKVVESGPALTAGEQTGELAAVLVEGIEELDAYYSQYLPGLVAALVFPVTILAFILPLDVLTGVIFIITAPLIPFFMLLIGNTAESLTRKQWHTLARLKVYFLDVLQGLTALKALGKSQSQAQVIESAGRRYLRITMGVLKVAFTSALALELIATLSTAVIAVQVGLRLLYGDLTFTRAFFILLLAPEFYQPLRQLGARFHSGMLGAAASQRIFSLLDRPAQPSENLIPRLQAGIPTMDDRQSIENRLATFGEIRLEDVYLSYAEGRSALHGVTMSLKRAEMLALVGPSGAGKSTIAGLLLRFLSRNRGEISLDGYPLDDIPLTAWRSQLAWVPQRPYLFPGSILDNLRLSKPAATFEKVVRAARAAHAHEFIQALPDSYHTLLAEGGSPLSSGQVQRLALARAYLRDAPILILDEVTASLDAEHEALLQESLARLRQDRTVLVIAHRLNTVLSADRIVVLDSGRVLQTGNHASLIKQGGLYRSLVEAALSPAAEPAMRKSYANSPSVLALISRSPPVSHGAIHSDPEDKPSFSRLLRWMLRWMMPNRGAILLAALAGVATILSSMALLGASAYLISAAALRPSIGELQVAIVGVRFFGLARGIFRYLERLLSHQVALRLLTSLRVRMYLALEPLAPARLQGFRSGDLLARLVGDIEALEGFYVRGLSPPLVAMLVGVAGFVFLWQISHLLAFILCAGYLAAGVGLPALSQRLSARASKETVTSRTQLETEIVSLVQGLPELEVFGQTETRLTEVTRLGRNLESAQWWTSQVGAFQASAGTLIANLCLWSLLVTSVPLVEEGQLPGVYLAAVLLAALVSFEAFVALPQAAGHLTGDMACASRLCELVDASPQVIDPAAPAPTPASPDLQVTDLSFRYPSVSRPGLAGGILPADEDSPWMLADINFSLPHGKRLALVGPSGSGKSTVISLLLRFWEFERGRILLGGRDLQDYSQALVRGQLAVLLQNPYLFSASLRDNLLLGRQGNTPLNDEQVDRALNAAGLGGFVGSLPQGYQTWLGEQGVRLSAGERQRIAIARTLLSSAPILVLDEPTAHLDSLTEQAVMDSILAHSESRSLLLVTHRLVGMQAMDEILVLSGGRIVERGQHSELLACGGLYRRMWDLQRQLLPG